jgi:hypothetical protein
MFRPEDLRVKFRAISALERRHRGPQAAKIPWECADSDFAQSIDRFSYGERVRRTVVKTRRCEVDTRWRAAMDQCIICALSEDGGSMVRIAAALMIMAAPGAFAYTAAELAAKNVTAKGGIEQLKAIQSLRLSGKLLVNGGTLELAYTVLVARPDVIRYEAQLQGLSQVQAYDGTQAWQINPFQGRKDPEKLSADDAKALGEDAADFIGTLVDYQAKGYKLDYLGTEDIDGTEAHKLRVTRPNGDVAYVYLDPDYFLEIRTVNRRIEHGIPNETITDYGDYEKVNGVYLPFALESYRKGSSDRQKLQIDKAAANVATDKSLFEFPRSPAGAASAK